MQRFATLAATAAFAPETETGSRVLPDLSADAKAHIEADGKARAEQSADATPDAKPAKPAKRNPRKRTAKPDAAKPDAKADGKAKPEQHGFKTAYRGASPSIRGHGRKLSPIVLDRIPNSFTARDDTFLRALHKQFGTKPFKRFDADAGAVSRLIGHGYLRHVSGNLDARDCTFAVTAKAENERFKKA